MIGKLALAAAILAVPAVSTAQQKPGPRIAIAGITLGSAQAAVMAGLKQRGHTLSSSRMQTATVNGLDQTQFNSYFFAHQLFPHSRIEDYGFLFTGPPQQPKAWGASFGSAYEVDGGRASADAPSIANTLSTLTGHYGAPAIEVQGTGYHNLYWFWTVGGAPVRPGAAAQACRTPFPSSMLITLTTNAYNMSNPAVGDSSELARFIKAGCGYGVEATINDTAGVVRGINIQGLDAVLAYGSFIETAKLVQGLEANRDRARLNQAAKAKTDF